MKILKIFGVVVGIHVFALMLIFANPGCSSSTKPAAPAVSDTVVRNEEPPPTVSVAAPHPGEAPVVTAAGETPISAAPLSFDPNAPAVGVRFAPTRPGTPAAATLEAQPVGDVTPATTYTVGKGDSLWTIAKKNHITVAEIAAANNIKAGATVRLGQKLIIPGRPTGATVAAEAAPAPKAATTTAAAPRASRESVKHVVKPGEVLGVIARKYGVTVGDIATANNITDPAKIRPGMELTIPGWQAPKGARGAAATHSEHAATPPAAAATPAPAASVPVVPAPEQDLDAGLQNKASEPPPVIKVDDSTGKP